MKVCNLCCHRIMCPAKGEPVPLVGIVNLSARSFFGLFLFSLPVSLYLSTAKIWEDAISLSVFMFWPCLAFLLLSFFSFIYCLGKQIQKKIEQE